MPRLPVTVLVLLFFVSIASAKAEKNLIRPPGTTRYAAMMQLLDALADYDTEHEGRLTISSLGKSVQGRDLWMATVGSGPRTIFYLCRQHGHEPASTEGALDFLDAMVKAKSGSSLAKLLDAATVYVVPMANPDGSEAYLRHNARNQDLNRDWLRRTQPETRALSAALSRLHPDLVTDQHELYPDDTRPDFTETAGPGSGATAEVVAACDDTQVVLQGAMRAEGFGTVSHLVTDTHSPRLAHRYISIVAGLPTLLFETNRAGGRTLSARAAAQKEFMLIVLRDRAGGREELLAETAAWHSAHPPMLASRHRMLGRVTGKPQTPAQEPIPD